MMPARDCPICRAPTVAAGLARGRRTHREFALLRCTQCGFGFVAEPWTDYAQIYDETYYQGRGSDPSVDYAYEFDHPERTIRQYEWRGLSRVIAQLRPAPAKWLDYGCGNAGLVRYARERTAYNVFGYDTGAWADKARRSGLAVLHEDELTEHRGTFDVVTAIEVIEHCVDPVGVLRSLRQLLKPGGLLFLTTGNAEKAPRDFASWYYVSPEIHVSYFTPQALRLAFAQTGFAARERGFVSGWGNVLRFKALKKLGIRNVNVLERCFPWPAFARWLDAKTGLSQHPLGIAV